MLGIITFLTLYYRLKRQISPLGKWEMLHKDYLLKHKKVVFATLLAEGKLWQYLSDIVTRAQHMFDTLAEQMKEREGVAEELKEPNRFEWVKRMNNIQ